MFLEKKRPVEFIAHRGESADAPENTLAAFRLAWERKVSAIELDVHLTRDGALIVSHDADTFRTTGVRKLIKDSTAAELRDLGAGKWKGEKWESEKLPTLTEALATIPKNGRCLIEVKVGPEAIPALVADIRASRKKPEQLPIISFNADTIAEAKRRLPKHKAYFLASFRRNLMGTWEPGVDALIQKAREIKADGLNLSFNGPIDADFVAKVKEAGLGMYVWTVDDPEVARRMVASGVDGITSNRAALLRDALASARG